MWIYIPLTLNILCSIDFCILYKNGIPKSKTCYEKWLIKLKMSSAENIFGSVSNFLTSQTSPRPTFLFNIGVVGQTPNSSWTSFNLMMAPIQKRAITYENKWPNQLNQHPLQMIASGFYYTGCGDHVTCFHCGNNSM